MAEETRKITQLDRLKMLAQKEATRKTNKVSFSNLVVCNLGVPPKEHFPKVKNADGTVKVDDNDRPVKSTKSDGWLFTFSQFGTCNKVMVILDTGYTLNVMGAYMLSGLGYTMRDSNLIYIDENVKITDY